MGSSMGTPNSAEFCVDRLLSTAQKGPLVQNFSNSSSTDSSKRVRSFELCHFGPQKYVILHYVLLCIKRIGKGIILDLLRLINCF